jgi:ssDNA-binding Zn-finger/Zn-ribbon topoisomerase 1
MSEIPNVCPRCGKPLEMRKGTYGTYLDCTDYPKCRYTYDLSSKNLTETKQISIITPSSCPKCGKKLALYIGKYGIFLGCNGYPKCNYSQNFKDTYKISCPKCGRIMKERTGTYGEFYGCSGYPKCKFTFDLRGKGKTKEKKPVKKLVLPDGYYDYIKTKIKEKKRSKKLVLPERHGFNITGDDILGALTREGQNLLELVNKLELIYEADIKYLELKLKEFKNKGLLVENSNENETIWKKTK